MKNILYILGVLLLLQACSKDDASGGQTPENITSRLNFIIDDNQFNFSSFNAGLSRTQYRLTLAQPGPYTILLPDNNAFTKAGYSNAQAVLVESGAVLSNMMAYHITNGTWEFNKLPFKFNQEIESIGGGKMYITRWVKNTDTIVTINGTRILSYNLKASNGLIQVMDAVLQPLTHQKLADAVAADASLSYFNVALQKAGMKSLLAGNDAYTLFAPNNAAFIAAGFPDIDSINKTDATELRNLIEYNMFSGRKFVYDYILTTDATDKTEQAMLNGNNITITLTKEGINYTGITLKGIGNTANGNIVKANVLAGNGVLHTTSLLLKERL
jgi:uncharacterized surface protein with fasciclin (FAS1) repeats